MVQGVEIVDGHIVDTDPATGREIARVKCTTEAEAVALLAAARAAQPGWEHGHSLEARRDALKGALAGLKADTAAEAELARLITAEMGKVAAEAAAEAAGAWDKAAMLDAIADANRPVALRAASESVADRRAGQTDRGGGGGGGGAEEGEGEEEEEEAGGSSCGAGSEAVVVRDALGVALVLAPWNFPADEILLLALPALVAGNCVVVKPSEVAPLTGAHVVSRLAARLPPGVLSLALGGGDLGAFLVGLEAPPPLGGGGENGGGENGGGGEGGGGEGGGGEGGGGGLALAGRGPSGGAGSAGGSGVWVDMVAMTGSSAVGKQVMAACAASLKRVVLELGGKDPFIVFADTVQRRQRQQHKQQEQGGQGGQGDDEDEDEALLDQAARDTVEFSLFNCGQVCCSVERVYVAASIHDRFLAKVVAAAREYTVGPGSSSAGGPRVGPRVGPMVSALQRERVEAQVRGALKDGAALAYQSPVPPPPPPPPTTAATAASGSSSGSSGVGSGGGGNWHPVTVLSGVTQAMGVMRDETFGPVVCVARFDGSEEAAVALANDTEYGLAAYLYTGDPDKAVRVARRVRAGQVGVNCYSLFHAHPLCPWVGHKGSGMGFHSGPDGWRQFSAPKSIVYPTGTKLPPAAIQAAATAAATAQECPLRAKL